MKTQATINDKMSIIAKVNEVMSGLSPQDKIAYSVARQYECNQAHKQADSIMANAENERRRAGANATLVAFGMCIPMMSLYATGEIPFEVGCIFGSGSAVCVGCYGYFALKCALTRKQLDKDLAEHETIKDASMSVCKNDKDVQEYKSNLRAEIDASRSNNSELQR